MHEPEGGKIMSYVHAHVTQLSHDPIYSCVQWVSMEWGNEEKGNTEMRKQENEEMVLE